MRLQRLLTRYIEPDRLTEVISVLRRIAAWYYHMAVVQR